MMCRFGYPASPPAASLVLLVLVSSLMSCSREQTSADRPVIKDRLVELVFPLLVDHDTEYGVGYSEAAFRELELGLSQQGVSELLGPPLAERRLSEDRTAWYYSRAGEESDNYYTRIVKFDEAGRVVAKVRTFYLD